MSAYTTLRITRSRALQQLMSKLAGDITDKQLEAFLDELLEPRLYNAWVVPDSETDNDNDALNCEVSGAEPNGEASRSTVKLAGNGSTAKG